MVAPFLLALGALGAGTVAQTAGQEFLRRRQGNQLGDILDNLPQDAGIDDTIRAMATGGLLSPQVFAQYGFDDARSERELMEQLMMRGGAGGGGGGGGMGMAFPEGAFGNFPDLSGSEFQGALDTVRNGGDAIQVLDQAYSFIEDNGFLGEVANREQRLQLQQQLESTVLPVIGSLANAGVLQEAEAQRLLEGIGSVGASPFDQRQLNLIEQTRARIVGSMDTQARRLDAQVYGIPFEASVQDVLGAIEAGVAPPAWQYSNRFQVPAPLTTNNNPAPPPEDVRPISSVPTGGNNGPMRITLDDPGNQRTGRGGVER
jgi:hypothetical protein